jgi:hypothetical protein
MYVILFRDGWSASKSGVLAQMHPRIHRSTTTIQHDKKQLSPAIMLLYSVARKNAGVAAADKAEAPL